MMRTLTAAILAALLLAGCGGDDGGEEATTTSASSQTFSIVESDFTLSPGTVTVDGAGTYTFEATNDGGVDHALEIEGNGIEEETETIAPGGSASLTVSLEAGTYEMYCPIGNHRDLGMTGEIAVG
jgi:uncharacterized cupredoxin-like copper-binding protein